MRSPARSTPRSTATSSTSRCRPALDLLTDIVISPRFTDDDLEVERGVILEEIKMVEDTPDDLVHEIFVTAFWPDHPLGRPILGTEETVNRLGREADPRALRRDLPSLEHDLLRVRKRAPRGDPPVSGEDVRQRHQAAHRTHVDARRRRRST